MGLGRSLSDGVVTIRPAVPRDLPALMNGRDALFHRFLGGEDPERIPSACVVVDGKVVGWVDYDHDRAWLGPDQVNLGYTVFPAHRGNGYATRAVRLLLCHLAEDTRWRVATLLISLENEHSLALARRAGFRRVADLGGTPSGRGLSRPARDMTTVVAAAPLGLCVAAVRSARVDRTSRDPH